MSHVFALWWPLVWALALFVAAAALLTAVVIEVARQVLQARGHDARPNPDRVRLLLGAGLALIAAMYLIPA